jgi:hypothetical protein
MPIPLWIFLIMQAFAVIVWGTQLSTVTKGNDIRIIAIESLLQADQAAGSERGVRITRIETQQDNFREALSDLRVALSSINVKIDRLIELRTHDVTTPDRRGQVVPP